MKSSAFFVAVIAFLVFVLWFSTGSQRFAMVKGLFGLVQFGMGFWTASSEGQLRADDPLLVTGTGQ